MMTLGQAALAYALRLGPVFPCQPRGKAPLTPNGFKDASTDPAQIEAWWHEHADANIGHVPGQSGHVVLDIDSAEGEATAPALGCLSEPTLTTLTARGRHL